MRRRRPNKQRRRPGERASRATPAAPAGWEGFRWIIAAGIAGVFTLAGASLGSFVTGCFDDRRNARQREERAEQRARDLRGAIRLVDNELQTHFDQLNLMAASGRVPSLLKALNGRVRFLPNSVWTAERQTLVANLPPGLSEDVENVYTDDENLRFVLLTKTPNARLPAQGLTSGDSIMDLCERVQKIRRSWPDIKPTRSASEPCATPLEPFPGEPEDQPRRPQEAGALGFGNAQRTISGPRQGEPAGTWSLDLAITVRNNSDRLLRIESAEVTVRRSVAPRTSGTTNMWVATSPGTSAPVNRIPLRPGGVRR